MENLNEVLELLKTATPMLQEFCEWKKAQAEREQEQAELEQEHEQHFQKWLKEKQNGDSYQKERAEERKRHLTTGDLYPTDRKFPKNY